MKAHLIGLLSATRFVENISFKNYIISLLCVDLKLCVDAVLNSTMYYPGICCPNISHASRETKLSLLSCVSASADSQIQELSLQLQLGSKSDYFLLKTACEQISSFSTARSLYIKAKQLSM